MEAIVAKNKEQGDLKVGQWLKRLRERRGLTQTEVAQRAGISPAFLSQLEGDKRTAAASTLRTVVQALDCYSLAEFLAMVEQGEHPVHRAEDRVTVTDPSMGVRVEYLGPRDGRSFSSCVQFIEMEPGYEAPVTVSDPEDQFFLVAKGKLGITLDGVDHEVNPGEVCFVNSWRPHRVKNLHDGPTEIIHTLSGEVRNRAVSAQNAASFASD